jgi:hypothetical protein
MDTGPADIMRSYILDIETIGLAEQAGMFCEALKDYLIEHGNPLEGMEFSYYADEPYQVSFIWDLGELRVGLTFMGDSDDSVWAVTTRRRRFRSAIGEDRANACREMMESLKVLKN